MYKPKDPITINTTHIKKLILGFDANILADPKTKYITVCTATYKESIPITLGVSILLSVIDWKIIVEKPIHPPVITIAINLGILCVNA